MVEAVSRVINVVLSTQVARFPLSFSWLARSETLKNCLPLSDQCVIRCTAERGHPTKYRLLPRLRSFGIRAMDSLCKDHDHLSSSQLLSITKIFEIFRITQIFIHLTFLNYIWIKIMKRSDSKLKILLVFVCFYWTMLLNRLPRTYITPAMRYALTFPSSLSLSVSPVFPFSLLHAVSWQKISSLSYASFPLVQVDPEIEKPWPQ